MPHQQGEFDGLCGVYSIVNAMKILQYRPDGSQELFNKLIFRLDEDRDLTHILVGGFKFNVLNELIERVICKDEIAKEVPFKGKKAVALGVVWDTMEKFMNDTNNSLPVIIIGLEGMHLHWTVVRRITSKRIYFEDSGKLTYINRKNITAAEPDVARFHRVVPNEIIFLKNRNAK